MCIAIKKSLGKKLSKDMYLNAYCNNSDGAGFAYIKEDRLRIYKGLMTWKSFWDAFEPLEEQAVAVHFRIRTSGKKNRFNCHPLRVSENLCFIHNGILPIKGDKEFSDTHYFNENVIKPLFRKNPEFWKNEAICWMLENAIGKGNKIVFIDSKGDFSILNEEEGNWEDDSWFSNRSHYYSTYGYGYGGWEDWQGYGCRSEYPGRRVYHQETNPQVRKAVRDYYSSQNKKTDNEVRERRRQRAYKKNIKNRSLNRIDMSQVDHRLTQLELEMTHQ